MTILNVWVSPDRALVGVDTLAAHPEAGKTVDGRVVPDTFEVTKLFPLAAPNVVLAGRGEAGLIWAVQLGCLATPGDYDILVERMPDMLAAAIKCHEAQGPLWRRRKAGALQIALVGWSARHERMLGVVFERAGPGRPFSRLDLGADDRLGGAESDDWIAPWEPEQGEAPVPSTNNAMLELVLGQMDHAPEGQPVGGRLIVADVGRDTLTVQALCDLRRLPAEAAEA